MNIRSVIAAVLLATIPAAAHAACPAGTATAEGYCWVKPTGWQVTHAAACASVGLTATATRVSVNWNATTLGSITTQFGYSSAGVYACCANSAWCNPTTMQCGTHSFSPSNDFWNYGHYGDSNWWPVYTCNPTSAVCGNGAVETTEACDDGNASDGDCCSSTCQYEAGGSPCGSASVTVCDNADTCNGAGTCQSNFVSSSTVCRADAGQCDVAESCTGSSATCPSDAFELVSTSCTGASQGGVCDNDVADHCSGAADSCIDGYRSGSTVCRVDAGDCDVAESCSGSAGSCPADSFEPPLTSCGSGVDTDCDNPDTCNGAGTCLNNYEAYGTTCDDGSVCTIEDACDGAGSCDALTTVFNRSCTWFSLGTSGSSATRGQTGKSSIVVGDLCFTRSKTFQNSSITGNVVSLQATGSKGARFSLHAAVTGDVATAGAGVFALDGAFLPHVTPATAAIAGGNIVAKDAVPGGVYDTSGSSPLLVDCANARADILAGIAEIGALAADQTNGDTYVDGGDVVTWIPTNPGGVNVIDYERLHGGSDVTINVDGGGNPDTVVIVRVARGLAFNENTVISMTNSMQANHFILLVGRGRTDIGNFSTVAGTIVAGGFLRIGQGSTVDGQLFGARRVEINAEVLGTLDPNEVVLP